MKFIIVTGLSGAGKTQTIKAFEDMGNYCVDNMPPQLIGKFAEIYMRGSNNNCAVIVCDIRGGKLFSELSGSLDELYDMGYDFEILFLDASDDVLIRRYKETRRSHPLSKDGRIIDGITKEREILQGIKEKATNIIDTSNLSAGQLREQIQVIYGSEKEYGKMAVHIISFGFKNGIPLDADLVFDVRFLPNPFYIPSLKEHTGLEACIRDYVMSSEISCEFLNKLFDMAEFLIPQYIKEGKSQLVIAIGCTGGHHRSITIAEGLYSKIKAKGHNVMVTHRDLKV